MQYEEILDLLSNFNLIAWLIAAIASFFLRKPHKESVSWHVSTGWTMVMIGSLFVVLRQLWKFLPGYEAAQASDLLLNMYMTRFMFGVGGALLISFGIFLLIINYFVIKAKMES